MGIFGPSNIEKIKTKKNQKGLIKALGYQKNDEVLSSSAEVLGKIGVPVPLNPSLPP